MKTYLDCYNCFITQAVKLAKRFLDEQEGYEYIQRIISILNNYDYRMPPPHMGRYIHKLIEEYKGFDIYKEEKEFYNNLILSIEEDIDHILSSSNDSFLSMLKLIIEGNYIDFGISSLNIDHKEVEKNLKKIVEEDITFIGIDYSSLKEKIYNAENILYLADNCGEVILDYFFIKRFLPKEKVIFVVRGENIINDVTLKEVKEIGIDKVVNKIITTGDNAPGVVLKTSSEEFIKEFYVSDLIILKGQGNYEGLSDVNRGNILFFLKVKCDVVAEDLKVEKFSNVVYYKDK